MIIPPPCVDAARVSPVSPGKPVFLQRLSIGQCRMSARARPGAGGALQRCGQPFGRGAVGSHQTSHGSRAKQGLALGLALKRQNRHGDPLVLTVYH